MGPEVTTRSVARDATISCALALVFVAGLILALLSISPPRNQPSGRPIIADHR